MITITHTHADGTLIEGSRKGDGVYDILRGLRDNWRYFPSIRQIGLGQSRDKAADTYKIKRAAEALRAAGHEVTVAVDESQRRSVAEIEADRAERAAARAGRLGERAERRGEQAQADYDRARQMAEAIPFGQPMMPDHYSYGRDRRYRDRIHTTFGRAFAGMDEARELERRAGAAEANQSYRESIPVTLRRIEKLDAEQRLIQRRLDGTEHPEVYRDEETGKLRARLTPATGAYRERLTVHMADIAEQLTYWHEHVKQAEADGVKVWGPGDFTKGDFVRTRWEWAEVTRVNPKSVSIAWDMNSRAEVIRASDAAGRRPWSYDKVQGRKSAAEMAAFLAEIEAKQPA